MKRDDKGFSEGMLWLAESPPPKKKKKERDGKLKMALSVKTVHFPCFTVVSQLSLQSDWVAGRRDHLSLPQTDFNLHQCYAPPK